MSQPIARSEVFEELRRRLFTLAYQMLGTLFAPMRLLQVMVAEWLLRPDELFTVAHASPGYIR